MRVLRGIGNLYRQDIAIGWVFGGIGTLTAYVWLDLSAAGSVAVLLAFCVAGGVIAGLIRRGD